MGIQAVFKNRNRIEGVSAPNVARKTVSRIYIEKVDIHILKTISILRNRVLIIKKKTKGTTRYKIIIH